MWWKKGERYKFGEVKVDSKIRDFKSEALTSRTSAMKNGDWYNAKMVEDTVEGLTAKAPACSATPSPRSIRNSIATKKRSP